eukprot:scaffold91356_cov51-Attheya_sp.AAC.2
MEERGRRHEDRPVYGRRPDDKSRSRSRSPDVESSGDGQQKSDRERLEQERRARMARLRAENEAEEDRLAAIDKAAADGTTDASSGQIPQVDEAELEGLDEDEQMRMLLGFSGSFATTKGTAVEDNQKSAASGAAAKNKARKYRQYMNRKGGFNRPLDKMS